MVYYDSLTAAITRYYVFNGVFREGEDSITYVDVDTELNEVAHNLEQEFAGTARTFTVELDDFDEYDDVEEMERPSRSRSRQAKPDKGLKNFTTNCTPLFLNYNIGFR